ncbi:hypothetical protein QTI17_31180 [Variovorax sp. J31P179]|uniref:hypothetical protein n=1 Tax=Variovorax sp. J31P179 TaxID=3053508 RepID=UPI002579036F|nr:hypothetical protein [Variovorax sp. J31P179]MDM0085061.1 hypothetical protein [Variovorax sp. J31P179]
MANTIDVWFTLDRVGSALRLAGALAKNKLDNLKGSARVGAYQYQFEPEPHRSDPQGQK